LYRVAGGAPLYLYSCSGGCPGVVEVNQSVIDGKASASGELVSHLNIQPVAGTTLTTYLGEVYKVAGGAPIYLSNCDAGCGTPVTVYTNTIDGYGSAAGEVHHLNMVPVNGTTLLAEETGGIYKLAGGAPLWLSSCDAGCGSPVQVNQGVIDAYGSAPGEAQHHLTLVPSDGTFLVAKETDKSYRTAGGTPFPITDCAALGSSGCNFANVVEVNTATITGEGTSAGGVQHLNRTPANGTPVEGLPSDTFWEFIGATRQSIAAPARYTPLNDAAIDVYRVGPTLSAADPAARRQGTGYAAMTLTGTGLQRGASVTSQTGGVAIGIPRVVSATSMTIAVAVSTSATAGADALTVHNPDGASAACSRCLTIDPAPALHSVSPASLPAGAAKKTLKLTGSGYQPGASVQITGGGVTVNTLTVSGATDIQLTVTVASNAASGARTITISNPDGGKASNDTLFSVS
jgi:Quinohemoprotein amine dehydrogenase, alpha subunit domain III